MDQPPIPAAAWDAAIDLRLPGRDSAAVIRTLRARAAAARYKDIGFPAAIDIDYTPVLDVFRELYNNVGDALASTPQGFAHTVELERQVVHWFADLFGLPAGDRWGYVTTGGTEANQAALLTARRRFPDALVYFSHAAHYSIEKITDILGVATNVVLVDEDARGEMDYGHLHQLVTRHRDRPAIVVATAGTTMCEAVDDTTRIQQILDDCGITQRFIHVDAALAGTALAIDGLLQLGPDSPVNSVATSGHKFYGTPVSCGVVLMADSARLARGRHVAYTATLDTTIAGSRSGQAAVLLWHAINEYGVDGHRHRAAAARAVAEYAVHRLTMIGWPAWRHERAFTVVLATPPAAVLERGWNLSRDGARSHLITMPGITMDQVDAFVADLAEVLERSTVVPRQRRRPELVWRAAVNGEDSLLAQ
ncbi:histidine decarboxylase [Actinoplanes utahensis]|uniref:histidine decarboxylase n=1 Tax=Actinoplanes utahensis TaxID=1869 RepID=UPI00068D4E36|nr:histidine decarboxylase [Actinoplanes utahensis]GIF28402.1 histidine decarboxylase [Actinoplanes utahensis]